MFESPDSMKNPTEEERKTKEKWDAIYKRGWDLFKDLCVKYGNDAEKWPIAIPKSAKPYINEDNPTEFLKPIFEHPKLKGPDGSTDSSPGDDTSKSERAFFKLSTRGKGANLEVDTNVSKGESDDDFSNDEEIHPKEFLGKGFRGKIILSFDGFYIGGHGSQRTHKVSMKFKVMEVR